jgi:hypothetical protein
MGPEEAGSFESEESFPLIAFNSIQIIAFEKQRAIPTKITA